MPLIADFVDTFAVQESARHLQHPRLVEAKAGAVANRETPLPARRRWCGRVGRLERGLAEAPGVCGIVGPVIASRSAPAVAASRGMRYNAATGRMRHAGVGD